MSDSKLHIANRDLWIDQGLDLEKRIIMLYDDIEECAAEKVIRYLKYLEKVGPGQEIEMYVSSFGGSCYEGLAIYDAMLECECPIITKCYGKAMSMGFVLFIAGDHRIATPSSTFMAHSVSSVSIGKIRDLEVDIEEGKRLNNMLLDIIALNTKKPKDWWAKKIKHEDFFFGHDIALELGVTDE